MNKWLGSVSIILVLVAGGVQAAGDAAAGKAKAATCLACHGADGNSLNPIWPKLAGQHPEYIIKQLNDFKAGSRKDAMMGPMALPLSDGDIENLAAFFSGQTRVAGEAAADQVAAGEKLYRAGNAGTDVAACIACHGPSGSGNPSANFPSINGQHAAYVVKSLKDFRSGARTNDNAQMMQKVVARMTDEEMTAVAQYVQGLR